MPPKYTPKYTLEEIDALLGSDSERSTMAPPDALSPTDTSKQTRRHPRTRSVSLRQAVAIAEAAAAKTTITDMALVTGSFSKPGVAAPGVAAPGVAAAADKEGNYGSKLFGATVPDQSILNPASAAINKMVPRYYLKYVDGTKEIYENLINSCYASFYPKGRQHQNLKRKHSGGLSNPNKDLFDFMRDSIQPTDDNYIALEKELYQSIGKTKLDVIVDWSDEEEGITWGTAILQTMCVLAIVNQMHPDSKIIDHPKFTGGNNGAKIEHSIKCLLTNFTAIFMFKLLKGPSAMWKNRKSKLADFIEEESFNTYVRPVMKWAVNACNPCPHKSITCTEIIHKHLYHFKKNSFEKASGFGSYSNAFILDKIKKSLGNQIHPVHLTPDMVKGVFFPHAVWLTMLVPGFHHELLKANKNNLEEDEKTLLSSVLKQSYF